ncbi:MAG: RHS repeat-associated core domain-containing protein [bacterium]
MRKRSVVILCLLATFLAISFGSARALVDKSSGNMMVSELDFSIPNGDLPLEVQRIYNLRENKGWGFKVGGIMLNEKGHESVFHPQSRVQFITTGLGRSGGALGYREVTRKVSVKEPPSDTSYVKWHHDGKYYMFYDIKLNKEAVSSTDPEYLLVKKESSFEISNKKSGMKYRYDLAFNLKEVESPSGNKLEFLTDHPQFIILPMPKPEIDEDNPSKQRRVIRIRDINNRNLVFEYNDKDQIVSIVYSPNRKIRYGYDSEGRLVRVTNAMGVTKTYGYEGERIIERSDYNGHHEQYEYDEQGRVSIYRDPLHNETKYGYEETDLDGDGDKDFTTTVTDYRGYSTTYYYTRFKYGQMKVTRIVDPLGYEEIYQYDGDTNRAANRISSINKNGHRINYYYDDNDNLIRIEDPAMHSIKVFEYIKGTSLVSEEREYMKAPEFHILHKKSKSPDKSLNVLQRSIQYRYLIDQRLLSEVIDPLGHSIKYDYSPYGRLKSKRDKNGGIKQYTYDQWGNIASITDAEGNITRFSSDDAGRVLREIDALGNRSINVWDNLDRLIEAGDALGNITRYTYDNNGNRLTTTDALNHTTIHQYDTLNRLIRETDPMGNTTHYEYLNDSTCPECQEDAGKVTRIVDANGNETRFEYDPLSRLITLIEPLERITRYTYDGAGNRLSMTDANGNRTTYAYDLLNRMISKTDANSNTATNSYDTLDRLIRRTDPLGGEIKYSYDAQGNILSITDANGNTTMFTYDKVGQKVKEIRPMGEEFIYAYNAIGNLSTVIDPKGQKSVYEYDKEGRVINIKYYGAVDHTTPEKIVSFTYDKIGNLKSYNDGITSAEYNYDSISKKISETVNYGAFTLSYSYTYNPDGTKRSFTGPDGITYAYTYTNSLLRSITIPGIGDIAYNNYEWLVPTTINLPGGTIKNLAYDPLMRIKDIQTRDPSNAILMNYTYTRDKEGNIVTKTTEHGDYSYSYDNLYQLLSADNPGANDEVYTYDKVGNRLTDSLRPGNWNYNANNQLIGYNRVSFEYDVNGNTIQKDDNGVITRYFYSVEDRLVRVEDGFGEVIATYYYDSKGKRLKKDVSGSVTYYFYSDEGLIGEYDITGNEIKIYGYTPDSTWMTDPLFMKEGSNYYYYQNDYLGTPQMMSDELGNRVWSIVYSVFGGTVTVDSSITNNLRLAGQYYDQETGFNYNWHRYYVPEIGRYLTQDPIGIDGGSNFYIYVMNNPQKNIDPTGELCLVDDTIFIMATTTALYFAIIYKCKCPDRTYREIIEVPRKPQKVKPPSNPCVYICMLCASEKWYLKTLFCPACLSCILFYR